ncbi:MAG: DUF481 domain-containing protein [Sandaracinaceae bacterium]
MQRFMVPLALALGLLPATVVAQPDAEQFRASTASRETEDVTRLVVNLGGALSQGNARTYAFNLGAQFALRRTIHAFLAEASWLYARAQTRPDDSRMFDPERDTTNNANWRLRYDLFVTPRDSLFAVHRGRNDPFANLQPRLAGQVGYAHYYLQEEKHKFWSEIGFDYTYDNFGEEINGATDRNLFSLRAFIGYINRLHDVLTYETGVEAIGNMLDPSRGMDNPIMAGAFSQWRFEWDNKIRSKIEDWLQLSIDAVFRFDSLPPGQLRAFDRRPDQAPPDDPLVDRLEMWDITATINLVGTFDLIDHDEPEPEAGDGEG